MTTHFRISALLSKIIISENEKAEIRNFLSKLQNNQILQNEFIDYCKLWKLAPWVFIQLTRNDLLSFFTQESIENFKNFYTKIKHQNENRNAEATRFLKIFEEQGIEVIILKGNLLIHRTYKDLGYKKMNDFDMLIHPKDWTQVQKIYDDLKYIPLGFGWAGEKQKPAKFSHAGMSFISANYQCITGTQWGLKSPTSQYTLKIEKAWESTSDFDFYGVKTKQLSPEFNILHLILHMGIYKIGIRDCMDIYNIFLTEEIDEDKLFTIIKEANALDKAYFTLKLCNLCANAINPNFIERLKPQKDSFIVRRLNSRLKMAERTGDFQLSYNDYFHEVETNVFHFGIYPQFHKKAVYYWRILKYVFWADKEVIYKLADIDKNASIIQKIKARLQAPAFSFALIGEEIGISIVFLLLFKLFFDMLFSVKNYIFKQESYFDFLKRININPKDIQLAVKEIQ